MKGPLSGGKLPPALLSRLIEQFDQSDPAIIIPPKVGIDAAGLQLNAGCYAVSTDPVTFTDNHISTYAISVNVNDIACLGAKPRWFTSSILLPEGTQESQVIELWEDLVRVLDQFNIKAIGGHVEVTPVVKQVVMIGQLIGECIGDALLDPRNCQPGDRILLWQPIALEGTAIIAQNYPGKLTPHFSQADIKKMQSYIHDPGICIWPLIKTLLPQPGVVALHDPTEGGLANALHELAVSCDCGLRIQEDAVPVLPETRLVSTLFGFDPLGLLASGSALIVCRPEVEGEVLAKLKGEPVAQLGELTADPMERLLFMGNDLRVLPQFDRDEIISMQHLKNGHLRTDGH